MFIELVKNETKFFGEEELKALAAEVAKGVTFFEETKTSTKKWLEDSQLDLAVKNFDEIFEELKHSNPTKDVLVFQSLSRIQSDFNTFKKFSPESETILKEKGPVAVEAYIRSRLLPIVLDELLEEL